MVALRNNTDVQNLSSHGCVIHRGNQNVELLNFRHLADALMAISAVFYSLIMNNNKCYDCVAEWNLV